MTTNTGTVRYKGFTLGGYTFKYFYPTVATFLTPFTAKRWIQAGWTAPLGGAKITASATYPDVWANEDNSTIIGGDVANYISAGDGNDTVNAGGGNDFVFGEAGNDWIYGGAGDDFLSGGIGNDVIYGQAGNDLIFGDDSSRSNYNAATGTGAGGADTLSGGDGNDTIYGGAGDDVIYGEAKTQGAAKSGVTYDDVLFGNDGNDSIYGQLGNDYLSGGAGNDLLNGGVGDDTLYGGEGRDTLIGGAGNDTFLFYKSSESSGSNIDTITDFDMGHDLLAIGYNGGITTLLTSVTATRDGKGGRDTMLSFDFGADGSIEYKIRLQNFSLDNLLTNGQIDVTKLNKLFYVYDSSQLTIPPM